MPKLTEKQLEKLSDISSDVALVALASVVLPGILDKFDAILIGGGLAATALFWALSIWLRR